MATRVPVLEEYYFRDGRRRLTRLASSSGISKAGETRIAREARRAIEVMARNVVDDVRTEYRRSGNAYNVMRGGGIKASGSTLYNLKLTIYGPEYIRALEQGTTIKPSTKQYLAIPVLDGVRPDGTPKLPSPRSWRSIVKTFVYTSKGKRGAAGRKFIAYKQGKELRMLYVLVEEVEMPRLAKLRAAYDRRAPDVLSVIEQAFRNELDRRENHLLPKARIKTKGGR